MRQRPAVIGTALFSAVGLAVGLGAPVGTAIGEIRNRAPLAPSVLSVNDQAAPLNIEGTPAFGWQPQDPDHHEFQSAYQIKVERAADGTPVWNSGRVRSAEQSYIDYAGPDLLPGREYHWTVRTWDSGGRSSPWAEPARFETGLTDEDWAGAEWIRRDAAEADEYTLARTEVTVADSPIVRARAYTAASHTYELFLNGQRADRGPSFGYPGEGYYQAADVTDLVEPGSPLAIGVRYHWYGDGQGRPAGEPGLLHKLLIEHEDGSTQIVDTDDSWRVTRDTRFVAESPLRNGEGDRVDEQDARGIIPGWNDADFDDTDWAAATSLGAHPAEPFTSVTGQETRVTETEIDAVELHTAADGTVVADFGVVVPARPIVRFDEGVDGRTLQLRAGYELTEDGRVDTSRLSTQNTLMTFPYTQVDGPQEYEAFTHLAFRYLEIPDAAEDIALDDVAAVLLHTEIPADAEATFTSSDDTLTEVWELMQRSALYSVQEQFVDTPTREKGQFLLDSANISYATMQGFGERDATQQAIREFLASQQRHWADGADSGRYNAVYPNGDGKRDIPDFTQMFVNWVWRYYQVTGDRSLLAEAYPAIRQTAEYVLRHIPGDGPTAGLVTELAGGSGDYEFGIIDWPAPGRFDYDMATAARTTINAQGVEVLRRTAQMAEELGRPAEEGEHYRAAQAALTEAMNEQLRAEDGAYVDGLYADGTQSDGRSQHATSYAIAFGIAPEADHPALAEHLASMGMRQGPMTAHWLLQALSDAERPDLVHDLLTDPTKLGWANILDQGATFTWEAWTREEGSNHSQSHGWGAQAAVDITETMLGIRPGDPGAATVRLVPPAAGPPDAEGTVHTQRGPVSLDWVRTDRGVRATAQLPVNVTGRVELPRVEGMTYRSTGRSRARYIETTEDRVIFEVGSGESRFVPVTGDGPR
ncbi:family 78 glycoside hydrolase catalytic domain [Actinoalloteichus hymeniacidonis]|uniref:alpha-L-rhamnosidase n=1 Tax=Actinoalloteichus hymeniacidonis TaxID=340345 RepID=A0AAC9N037_9PSEU|nr:family 78 glycoside hydrolase catalytic domain [Actinoalloteichus hymeniacidonis]AOS64561.1 alpha-L-rhamnosidase [Actinoalloteichus hymeniacidonis]MBB5907367.1 alpha-L-rhamnosidase [Actinoalloteichus hymeniacidonis]